MDTRGPSDRHGDPEQLDGVGGVEGFEHTSCQVSQSQCHGHDGEAGRQGELSRLAEPGRSRGRLTRERGVEFVLDSLAPVPLHVSRSVVQACLCICSVPPLQAGKETMTCFYSVPSPAARVRSLPPWTHHLMQDP